MTDAKLGPQPGAPRPSRTPIEQRTTTQVPTAPEVARASLLGNQSLQQLMKAHALQTKLTISSPSDLYEQEADRVAGQIMQTSLPAEQSLSHEPKQELSRQPLEEEEPIVARMAQGSSPVEGEIETSVDALRGGGQPLPEAARNFMEPRFRADFSAVRVHDDAQAHELARAVNAQAFTVGRDVVFAAGHYAPESDPGKRLLAHELTHVMQQGAAGHTEMHRAWLQRDEAKNPAPAEKAPEPAISFVSPIPAGLKLGRGLSDQPVHQGIDIAMPIGISILAAAAGKVVHASEISGYGTAVDIAHGTQYTTRYAHLSELKCKVDDQVTAGQQIALSGNTGRSTGPHLHFEVRSGGRWGPALDPKSLVPSRHERWQSVFLLSAVSVLLSSGFSRQAGRHSRLPTTTRLN